MTIPRVDVPGPFPGNFTAWSGLLCGNPRLPAAARPRVPIQGNLALPFTRKFGMLAGNAGDGILAPHLLQHVGGPDASLRHAVIERMARVDAARRMYGNAAGIRRDGAVHCVRALDRLATGSGPAASCTARLLPGFNDSRTVAFRCAGAHRGSRAAWVRTGRQHAVGLATGPESSAEKMPAPRTCFH